jgi:PAS domain S-box-containing protein
MEVTLAEERNLLRTLIDNLPERIFIKDTESRFILANQAVLRLMQLTRMEELIGKTDFDFHPAEFAAQYYADEQAVMQSGEPMIGREGGRTAPSGEQRWYLTTKVPLRDSQGQIIGLVGLNQDITARKRSEEELQRHRDHLEDLIVERTAELSAANQKLQQEIVDRQRAEAEREQLYQQTQKQAEQLEQILNAVQAGIILLDNEYRIKAVNSTAQICLPILTNVDLGQPCTHLGGHPLSEFLSELPPGGYYEVTPEGESRPIFEVKMRPVIAAPEAAGWVLVARDVTDQRDIQKRAQEQEKLAAVGQLAAGIAHDFNNILTSIIGFAELARYEANVPVSVQTDLNHVVQQGKRAANLVRQILDFARKNITSKRPLEFNGFLADVVRLLERTIPETIRLELEIESVQETFTLNADATQLQQVLTNLAVNAADAMPSGGLLKFRLSRFTLQPGQWPPCPGLAPGDWLVLTIMDTGTGISAKDLPHIFEPFFTTKEVGQGTGLGLAQVDGIIKQHDGYINVESKVGKGTTFTLYLPLFQAKRSSLFEVNPRTKFSGRGETLLLVEDDPAVLEVTQAMLKGLGYQVLTASNGLVALDIYDRHRDQIAVVITDLTMPNMGGLALAEALQAKNREIKILAMTGYPLKIGTGALRANGISGWLQKPLSLEQLAKKLDQVLKM